MAAGVPSDHGTRRRHPRRRLHRARRDRDRGHGAHHALCDPVQGHALPGPSPSPVCGQVSHWGGHLRKRAGRPAVHRTSNDTPEGDDMTASAGAATAAPEELSTAVPGETAGAQAAIVIVSRDPGAREILHQELIKRYGADYQIVVCDRPVELESWMRGLRAASRPVALVIG